MSTTNTTAPTGGDSKFMSTAKSYGGIILFSLGAIGFFIGAFVGMSNFIGSKDDWNQIKPQVTKIIILSIMGVVLLMIAALLYFIQDPSKTMYFILIISCLSLGLSFSAVGIAAISR
jgi:hypothetical protein